MTDRPKPNYGDLRIRVKRWDRFEWGAVLERYSPSYSGGISHWAFVYQWRKGWFRWVVMAKIKLDLMRVRKGQRIADRRKSYRSKGESVINL